MPSETLYRDGVLRDSTVDGALDSGVWEGGTVRVGALLTEYSRVVKKRQNVLGTFPPKSLLVDGQ